jgi:hypothetical protein
MTTPKTTAAFALLSLAIAGACSPKRALPRYQMASSAMMSPPSPGAGQVRRYIAVRHELIVETSEDQVQAAWESAAEFCRSIRCEVTASSMSRGNPVDPTTAKVSMRVHPEDVKKLFSHLGKAGAILRQSTESEDKTDTVIDVEAQITNLTGFRDNLRAMLGRPSGSLKDALEVQRELVRVQTELDSATTRRKALAAETEKVAVEIAFRASRSLMRRGVFSPIASALRDSGGVLSESVAALITTTAALIPWILVMVPGFWLLRKLWRRWRGGRVRPPRETATP